MSSTNQHGYQAAIMKVWRARDFRLEVIERSAPTDQSVVLRFRGGGLLEDLAIYPTIWLRLWFDNQGKSHQRAFTILDPDLATDTFSLLFVLHDGPAANWARDAQPGDQIESSLLSSKFAIPEPVPDEFLLVGDVASLPAINTILEQIPDVPARVLMGYLHDSDLDLPVSATDRHHLEWVPRAMDTAPLIEASTGALEAIDCGGGYVWVACDARTTRAVVRLAKHAGFAREQIKHQAYWR